jgi:hypothetical protein
MENLPQGFYGIDDPAGGVRSWDGLGSSLADYGSGRAS